MGVKVMKKMFYSIVLTAMLLVNPANVIADSVFDYSALYYYDELESGTNRQQYINKMMHYYIESNKQLQEELSEGRFVVMMFEGGSENYDDSKRCAAECLILKAEGNKIEIQDRFSDCSTLPDYPVIIGEIKEGESQTTIFDGIYSLYTCNHNGEYAALNVRKVDESGEDSAYFRGEYVNEVIYQEGECYGINVHTRSDYGPFSVNTPRSEGCILVSKKTDRGGSYDEFMETLTGKINAGTSLFSSDEVEKKIGALVIDRQLYNVAMQSLYGNANAVENLLSFSTNTLLEYNNESNAYLNEANNGAYCFPQNKTGIVKTDCKLHSLPCASNTNPASYVVGLKKYGEEVLIESEVVNPLNNKFYKVVSLDNEFLGYIYEENFYFK